MLVFRLRYPKEPHFAFLGDFKPRNPCLLVLISRFAKHPPTRGISVFAGLPCQRGLLTFAVEKLGKCAPYETPHFSVEDSPVPDLSASPPREGLCAVDLLMNNFIEVR